MFLFSLHKQNNSLFLLYENYNLIKRSFQYPDSRLVLTPKMKKRWNLVHIEFFLNWLNGFKNIESENINKPNLVCGEWNSNHWNCTQVVDRHATVEATYNAILGINMLQCANHSNSETTKCADFKMSMLRRKKRSKPKFECLDTKQSVPEFSGFWIHHSQLHSSSRHIQWVRKWLSYCTGQTARQQLSWQI